MTTAEKRTDNKGRILRSGEGQRNDTQAYYFRYQDSSGHRKTIYSQSLKELREKESLIQKDLLDGIRTAKMTLNDLFDDFMTSKRNIRDTTKRTYETLWNSRVKDSAIGGKQISDIRRSDILNLLAIYHDEKLTTGTIRQLFALINATLEYAVRDDFLRKNPCRDCGKEIVSGIKNERCALTIAEETELLNYIKDSNVYCEYYPLIIFLLQTGLRVSECFGLTWDNVHLKKGCITIEKQLLYKNSDGKNWKFYISDLKTETSHRSVPLSKNAREALTEQRKLNLLLSSENPDREIDGIPVSKFIFRNKNGNPRQVTELNQILNRIVASHNKHSKENDTILPHLSAHLLRHTCATRLSENGMSLEMIQRILGHSSISTTANFYLQLDFSEICKAFNEADSKMAI